MENINAMSDRTVLKKILELLLESKIYTDELQFQNNKDVKTKDDIDWFSYVEKDNWVFQGNKNGWWIRLINPDGIRVAQHSSKDKFVAECRKLLRKF